MAETKENGRQKRMEVDWCTDVQGPFYPLESQSALISTAQHGGVSVLLLRTDFISAFYNHVVSTERFGNRMGMTEIEWG